MAARRPRRPLRSPWSTSSVVSSAGATTASKLRQAASSVRGHAVPRVPLPATAAHVPGVDARVQTQVCDRTNCFKIRSRLWLSLAGATTASKLQQAASSARGHAVVPRVPLPATTSNVPGSTDSGLITR